MTTPHRHSRHAVKSSLYLAGRRRRWGSECTVELLLEFMIEFAEFEQFGSHLLIAVDIGVETAHFGTERIPS